MAATDPTGPADDDHELRLANEFADARVRVVHTRNGVRLAISAPKLGREVWLCPLQLESLTWQPPETFSAFLATPFGPEPEAE